ncbi:hypothetical protein KR093_007849 [Drosophila rubida]|uniref:Uncharacterized protein n=1 Tax=Drosophila rubida TaxID=30044 RepID=A0AAD4JWL0_9MUSC|nr:hypothetical protein KR093_007849 [Drosophila rubida]
MANNGFCSNEQIIKLVQKRYKHLGIHITPFMAYLEEYIEYLRVHAFKENFDMNEIAQMARFNWKMLKKNEKMRYMSIAIHADIS